MYSSRCLHCDQSLHHSFHESTDPPLWSHTEQLYVNVKLFVMRLVCGVCNTTKNKAPVNICIWFSCFFLSPGPTFVTLEPGLSPTACRRVNFSGESEIYIFFSFCACRMRTPGATTTTCWTILRSTINTTTPTTAGGSRPKWTSGSSSWSPSVPSPYSRCDSPPPQKKKYLHPNESLSNRWEISHLAHLILFTYFHKPWVPEAALRPHCHVTGWLITRHGPCCQIMLTHLLHCFPHVDIDLFTFSTFVCFFSLGFTIGSHPIIRYYLAYFRKRFSIQSWSKSLHRRKCLLILLLISWSASHFCSRHYVTIACFASIFRRNEASWPVRNTQSDVHLWLWGLLLTAESQQIVFSCNTTYYLHVIYWLTACEFISLLLTI